MTLAHLPDIYFIRHGQTDWNAEQRYQGRRNVPLNAVGEAQADANGRLLFDLFRARDLDPLSFRWRVSPLDRARETARRVGVAFADTKLAFEYDERLMEMSYGVLEGHLLTEIDPNEMPPHGSRDPDFWYFRPREGESFDDLAERVRAVITEIDGPTVIIAHGGVVRVMRHLIADAPRGEVVNWAVPQNGIMTFRKGEMDFIPAQAASPA